jgi:hypothetical protein
MREITGRKCQGRIGRLGVAAAALLPFALSVVFHGIGPHAQSAVPAAPRAALVFDQYQVDLGEAAPAAFAVAEFRFANRSNRTVAIRDLQPSCGCLTPRLEKRIYGPNETGTFLLRVQTANEEPGPKQYWVKLRYDDPDPRAVELSFKVVLPQEKVVVRPKALIFYQLGEKPTSQEVAVIDYRGKGLGIVGVESSSPLVSVEVLDPEKDADGNHRQRVSITVTGAVPTGRHNALVNIVTDDAVYQTLRVPLVIEGLERAPHEPPGARPRLSTAGR